MSSDSNKEEQILKAMKMTLTTIIKETATKPGFKHPLSESTMKGMRDCLVLISQREQELAEANGRSMDARPRFPDEIPKSSAEVVVSIDSIRSSKSE